MDYRDKVFISVAENLNFSKAAEELFISQPAVTKHIKELESSINTALFQRKGNKVFLTKSGKLMYRHLKIIQRQYNEMEYELGKLNNVFKGNLNIGASSTISQYLIPAVIAAFHSRYPKVNVKLLNGNSFEMEQKLLKANVDIALVENCSSAANIKYIDFLDDEIVGVAGSSSVYAKRKNITIADILEIPLVVREKGSGTLQVIEQALLQNKINPKNLNVLIHLGSTETIKNFLNNFEGIALISAKAIEKELLLKHLVTINIKNLRIHRKFRIALRQGPTSQITETFLSFLNSYNF